MAFLVGWVTPVGLEDGDAGVFKQTIGNIVSGLTGGAMIAYTSATMLPVHTPTAYSVGFSRPACTTTTFDHTVSVVCLQAAFERSGRNATLSGLLCTIGFVAALTMEVFAGPMDDATGDGSLPSGAV